MKAESTVKTWEKTRLQNLVRHKSGRYYARLFLNGKEIWKSLKTSHFSVAEAKLAEVQKEHKIRRAKDVEPATARVFLVRESQKSIDRAAKKTGMTRITHHDLRHFFATVCIESGVDIPTVSRWLGHKDGGALAMRTYGHLRREHSVAQAQKVSFAPVANAA